MSKQKIKKSSAGLHPKRGGLRGVAVIDLWALYIPDGTVVGVAAEKSEAEMQADLIIEYGLKSVRAGRVQIALGPVIDGVIYGRLRNAGGRPMTFGEKLNETAWMQEKKKEVKKEINYGK